MAQQTINIGASPNDGTGTPLRTSFDYTNQNFTELYTALGGGVGLPGATTQVIFNDGGTNLAGDAGLVYNKTTDALTVAGLVTAGSATITGDLTVDTSTLKVDSTNDRVGIKNASPNDTLTIAADNYLSFQTTVTTLNSGRAGRIGAISAGTGNGYLVFETYQGGSGGGERYRIASDGVSTWSVAGTTAMTLNSTGLGIGNVPVSGQRLTVEGGDIYLKSANKLTLDNAYNNFGAQIYNIGASAQAALAFVLGATQAMTLDASGNLLVGRTTMAGSERLHIEGSVTSFVSRFSNTSATTPSGLFVRYSSAAPNGTGDFFVRCDDNVATRFELRSNGGLANYSANNVNLSDARTKTDIKPLISYWNKIKALELVTFKYKDQTHDDDNIGLISQQVESVAPEFVSNDGFGQTPADGVPLKGIYTTDLYHGAIKALQEAMTRIEVLEAKLA